jgi:hypothetical protein
MSAVGKEGRQHVFQVSELVPVTDVTAVRLRRWPVQPGQTEGQFGDIISCSWTRWQRKGPARAEGGFSHPVEGRHRLVPGRANN